MCRLRDRWYPHGGGCGCKCRCDEFLVSLLLPSAAKDQTLRDAVGRGLMCTIPVMLFALFMILPPLTTQIFLTFSCREFGYTEHSTRTFIDTDLAVECDGERYDKLHGLAVFLVFLWPIGVLLLFSVLLFPSHFFSLVGGLFPSLQNRTIHPSSHGPSHNIFGFLHREYKPGFRFWPLAELARKLVLTGVAR